jgi:DNA-binding transcriptional regulator YdaS (Cro superfamily)
MDAISQAIEICGTQAALAEAIGVTPQAVNQWVTKGQVPIERVVAVEQATGGKVTRQQLRPDIFGDPPPKPLADGGVGERDSGSPDDEKVVNA